MYTIKEISDISGVTTRTLRHYDNINLLKPSYVTEAGYRIYGSKEINKLQEILFYKELDFSLEEIKKIFDNNIGRKKILLEQKKQIKEKILRLEHIMETIENSIKEEKGELIMTDNEKFETFKKNQIDENEKKYGNEIREKYGNDTIDATNKKFKGMTKEQYAKYESLNEELNETIKLAFATNDPTSDLAKKMCQLHKDWLMIFWTSYSIEMHLGLTQMYVDDERFTKYYDDIQIGSAEFLNEAMKNFLA